jgi:hypothetical protein
MSLHRKGRPFSLQALFHFFSWLEEAVHPVLLPCVLVSSALDLQFGKPVPTALTTRLQSVKT